MLCLINAFNNRSACLFGASFTPPLIIGDSSTFNLRGFASLLVTYVEPWYVLIAPELGSLVPKVGAEAFVSLTIETCIVCLFESTATFKLVIDSFDFSARSSHHKHPCVVDARRKQVPGVSSTIVKSEPDDFLGVAS